VLSTTTEGKAVAISFLKEFEKIQALNLVLCPQVSSSTIDL